MSSHLRPAKQHLRSLMQQRLSSLPGDSILAQSRAVFQTLTQLDSYRRAQNISIFLSMPTAEIQTDAIVRHAIQHGKQVFVPYLHKSSPEASDAPARVMDMVLLKGIHDYENLQMDRLGIPIVDPATVRTRQRVLDGSASSSPRLDMILIPGVAFDFDNVGSIRRLGHGKGFYDYFLYRYLARILPASPEQEPPHLIGLALTEQLLSPDSGKGIPVDLHDHQLHALVLGNGDFRESSTRSI